jgi:hypothetical protein
VARVSNCAHAGAAVPTTANSAASAYTTGRKRRRQKGVITILTPLLVLQTALRQGEPLTSRKAYHDIRISPSSLSSPYGAQPD